MRLIDARKFVNGERDIFRDRNDSDYFSYAILSHRWEDEEVSFQDVRQLHASPFLKERKGYRKVLSACLRALADCFLYIWIDTCKCCIQCVGSVVRRLPHMPPSVAYEAPNWRLLLPSSSRGYIGPVGTANRKVSLWCPTKSSRALRFTTLVIR
jgi:hypothetical protein